jgi:hypothetical protein
MMTKKRRKDSRSRGRGIAHVQTVKNAIASGEYPGSRDEAELSSSEKEILDLVVDDALDSLIEEELRGD